MIIMVSIVIGVMVTLVNTFIKTRTLKICILLYANQPKTLIDKCLKIHVVPC